MQEEKVFDEEKILKHFCGLAAWELETGVLLVADSLKTVQEELLLGDSQRWGLLNLIRAGAFHWEEPYRDGTESVRRDKQGRRIILTGNVGFTHYDYFQWGMDTLHSTEAYIRALAALHGGQIEKLSRETVLQGKTVFYVRPASFIAWAESSGFQISERIREAFVSQRDDAKKAPRNSEPTKESTANRKSANGECPDMSGSVVLHPEREEMRYTDLIEQLHKEAGISIDAARNRLYRALKETPEELPRKGDRRGAPFYKLEALAWIDKNKKKKPRVRKENDDDDYDPYDVKELT